MNENIGSLDYRYAIIHNISQPNLSQICSEATAGLKPSRLTLLVGGGGRFSPTHFFLSSFVPLGEKTFVLQTF